VEVWVLLVSSDNGEDIDVFDTKETAISWFTGVVHGFGLWEPGPDASCSDKLEAIHHLDTHGWFTYDNGLHYSLSCATVITQGDSK